MHGKTLRYPATHRVFDRIGRAVSIIFIRDTSWFSHWIRPHRGLTSPKTQIRRESHGLHLTQDVGEARALAHSVAQCCSLSADFTWTGLSADADGVVRDNSISVVRSRSALTARTIATE